MMETARRLLAEADDGPWHVCSLSYYVMSTGRGMVADTGEFDDETPPGAVARIRGTGRGAPQAANLRLIAAAPELLERLCTALQAERQRAEAAEAKLAELRERVAERPCPDCGLDVNGIFPGDAGALDCDRCELVARRLEPEGVDDGQ